eukprot:SAG31_NODE_463_length_15332_cov_5.907700_6_plen_247_part_00
MFRDASRCFEMFRDIYLNLRQREARAVACQQARATTTDIIIIITSAEAGQCGALLRADRDRHVLRHACTCTVTAARDTAARGVALAQRRAPCHAQQRRDLSAAHRARRARRRLPQRGDLPVAAPRGARLRELLREPPLRRLASVPHLYVQRGAACQQQQSQKMVPVGSMVCPDASTWSSMVCPHTVGGRARGGGGDRLAAASCRRRPKRRRPKRRRPKRRWGIYALSGRARVLRRPEFKTGTPEVP